MPLQLTLTRLRATAIGARTDAQPTLCNYCFTLPLGVDPDDLSDGAAYLGSLQRVRSESCPFCQLVASAFNSCPSEEEVEAIEVVWSDIPGFRISNSAASSMARICYITGGNHSYRWAKAITGKWINVEIPKRWLKTCETQHGDQCLPPQLEEFDSNSSQVPLQTFRLLDVYSMCLVDAPNPCRYVALSYVWGANAADDGRLFLQTTNKRALMKPGSLKSLQKSIPKTILDALKFVRSIGLRFLWVDSLCILQNNREELKESVKTMDSVYEMSFLTIIAANGADAHAGLPGVHSTPRRCRQTIKEVKSGISMTLVEDLDFYLEKSPYSRRAWT